MISSETQFKLTSVAHFMLSWQNYEKRSKIAFFSRCTTAELGSSLFAWAEDCEEVRHLMLAMKVQGNLELEMLLYYMIYFYDMEGSDQFEISSHR